MWEQSNAAAAHAAAYMNQPQDYSFTGNMEGRPGPQQPPPHYQVPHQQQPGQASIPKLAVVYNYAPHQVQQQPPQAHQVMQHSPQQHQMSVPSMQQQQQQQQVVQPQQPPPPQQHMSQQKPRGKMTPYACFVKVIRAEHKKKHPNESIVFSEFSKKCAEKWRQMTDKEKRRFQEMAEKDKERYENEMQNYQPPDGQQKARPKKRKKPKDPDAPKRALSAFMWFCKDFRHEVKEKNPEMRMGDIAKVLSERWRNQVNKEVYEGKANADKSRYADAMKIFRATKGVGPHGGKVTNAQARAAAIAYPAVSAAHGNTPANMLPAPIQAVAGTPIPSQPPQMMAPVPGQYIPSDQMVQPAKKARKDSSSSSSSGSSSDSSSDSEQESDQ